MQDTVELARRIRRHAVEMTHLGKSSHIGSVLSMADIIAVLYGQVMEVDPANPHWVGRDRFILSKGHAGAGIYAALAECGFFPLEKLRTHYQDGSDLSGHVSHKGVPGVEFSTGSLGHGLPVATGMALAGKLDDANHRVFVVLSDGECDEGSNWEAALFAAHHKLSNLVIVIDFNKIQSLALVAETMALEPFGDKWRSFGFEVEEVDGHDVQALESLVKRLPLNAKKPTAVICHTIKGKGFPFAEGKADWHHKSGLTAKDIQAMYDCLN
jgi:transketolase